MISSFKDLEYAWKYRGNVIFAVNNALKTIFSVDKRSRRLNPNTFRNLCFNLFYPDQVRRLRDSKQAFLDGMECFHEYLGFKDLNMLLSRYGACSLDFL